MSSLSPGRWLTTLLILATAVGATAQIEPATRTLYLVRHGFYDWVKGADDRTENALNDLGREQAALAGAFLASLPVTFDSFTSSEFSRARETGDIMAAMLKRPCLRDARLNETTPAGRGVPDKSVDADAETQLNAAWAHFFRPNTDAPTHEVLVCHGNVIRWLVCRALDVEVTHWTGFEIANASVTMIQVRPDGTVRVQFFNSISHVPVELQTWSGRGPAWPLPAQSRGN